MFAEMKQNSKVCICIQYFIHIGNKTSFSSILCHISLMFIFRSTISPISFDKLLSYSFNKLLQ